MDEKARVDDAFGDKCLIEWFDLKCVTFQFFIFTKEIILKTK